MSNVSVYADAQDEWSDPLWVPQGLFSVSISGTFSATVSVQRNHNESTKTPDEDSEWHDVETYDETSELTGEEGSGAWYRIGVATGDYTSGAVSGRIAA